MKTHNNELEIDEDVSLERSTWKVQRIGWALMFLVIVAALLGFTGRGGLKGINQLSASTPTNSMELEYDRFLRNEVTTEIKVKLRNLTTSSSSIFFSKDFHQKIRVEQVIPEPDKVQVSDKGITYTFNTHSSESHAIFYIKPMHAGSLTVTAQGPDNQPFTISQFVYP